MPLKPVIGGFVDCPTASGGGESGVVDGQQLFDAAMPHQLSLDAGARQLYYPDGTTIIIDWSNGLLNDSAGHLSFGFGDRKLYNYDGTIAAAWDVGEGPKFYTDSLGNYGGDELPNIDLLNRKLYNPDGTTVALDYGTNGTAQIGSGTSLITTREQATGGSGGGLFSDCFLQAGGASIECSTDDVTGSELDLAATTILISTTKVVINTLPTSDPHVVNQLWNSAGTLKISAG